MYRERDDLRSDKTILEMLIGTKEELSKSASGGKQATDSNYYVWIGKKRR